MLKKTLIVFLLSLSPMSGFTNSIIIYGAIESGIEHTKVKGIKSEKINLYDRGSFIGFRGYEKLTDSVEAFWQIEQDLSIDNRPGRDRFANRDTFLGIKSNMGTLRIGYLPDSVKTELDRLDFWEGGSIRTLGHYNRYGDKLTGIRYDTPYMNGFYANIAYLPEDNLRYDEARDNGSTEDINDFSKLTHSIDTVTKYRNFITFGVGYNANHFFASYAFKNAKNRVEINQTTQVHGIQIGYDSNQYFIGAGYKYSKNFLGAHVKGRETALSMSYTKGNLKSKLSLSRGEAQKKIDRIKGKKSKYQHAVIGFDYFLNYRTTIVSSFAWQEKIIGNKKLSETYSSGIGLIHRF